MRYNDMVEKKRDDRIAFKPLFSTEKINEDPPFELNYAFFFMHGRKSFFFGFSRLLSNFIKQIHDSFILWIYTIIKQYAYIFWFISIQYGNLKNKKKIE